MFFSHDHPCQNRRNKFLVHLESPGAELIGDEEQVGITVQNQVIQMRNNSHRDYFMVNRRKSKSVRDAGITNGQNNRLHVAFSKANLLGSDVDFSTMAPKIMV